MNNTDAFRGNPIRYDCDAEEWVYSDTGESTIETWRDKPCGACGKHFTTEGHDGCFGELPGVVNACCGHGNSDDAYVQFNDGTELRERRAIDFFDAIRKRAECD